MLDVICFSPINILKFVFFVSPFIITIYLIFKGVIPVLYRLGIGLSKKNIAIFAKDQEFNELKRVLLQSKLFNEKNIIQINNSNMEMASESNIFLVYWEDSKDYFDEIRRKKTKDTPLIVYAPYSGSSENSNIDKENLCLINNTMNANVVRFKGRLLNDILTSMMTTSYTK